MTAWTYLLPPSHFGRASDTVIAASGTRVTFADGVEAQCGRSGLWNVNFGYGNDHVAAAIDEATRGVTYLPLFRTSHPWADRASSTLIDLLGADHYSHTLFSTSGSAANDAVMKMARHWAALRGEPGRAIVVGLTGSYHGQTYGAISVSGDDLMQPLYKVDQRLVRHVAPDDVEGLHQLLDRQGSKIAAVVIEPVLGNGTIPVPQPFIDALMERRHRDGYLVVADEVATGFFRTGPRFATDEWVEKPDVVITSKGLTNGSCGAAAAVLGHRVTEPFLTHDSMLVHGETQGGSPPSCAAMIAVAELSQQPEIVTAAAEAEAHLAGRLRTLVDHPLVAAIAGRGCFRSLTLTNGAGHVVDPDERSQVMEHIRLAGSWVYPGPTGVQIIPPVVSTPSEIDALIDGIEAGLNHFADRQEVGVGALAISR